MSLYLIVLTLVISIPLLLSFEKNLRLYKRWKFILPAIIISMLVFIIWDIIFTQTGCWIFNPIHNSGIYIFKLPLEEYLFFISIPYACIFSFEAMIFHFPKYRVNSKLTTILTGFILVFSLIVAFTNTHRIYTLVNFLVLAAILLGSYIFARKVLSYYYAIFPILLIPFFIVNSILTGSGINQEVFSYNQEVITGIYLFTMPMEDMFYAFSLLLLVFSLAYLLENRTKKLLVS